MIKLSYYDIIQKYKILNNDYYFKYRKIIKKIFNKKKLKIYKEYIKNSQI